MATLANVSTAAGYTSAATLEVPGGKRVRFSIVNNSARYQIGRGRPVPVYSDELIALPGFYSLLGDVDGIRFRDAVSGTHALIVSAEIVTP